MTAFLDHWRSALVSADDLAGRWLVVASLPRGDHRCRHMRALIQAAPAFRARSARIVILVDDTTGEAELIRSMAEAREGHAEVLVLADNHRQIATDLGMMDAAGRFTSASIVIDPEGLARGLMRHHLEQGPPIEGMLAMFDALRAGRAGCVPTRPVQHA
jgi:alkyl hydroperoxide reductase subunit AhpC